MHPVLFIGGAFMAGVLVAALLDYIAYNMPNAVVFGGNNEDVMAPWSLAELTQTNTGVSNVPTAEQIANLQITAKKLFDLLTMSGLEPSDIVVTSGFRSFQVNAIVGGVSNSLHLQGKAVDLKGDLGNLSILEKTNDESGAFYECLYHKNHLHLGWL